MTVVRFTTGESWDVIDADCEWRPCFAPFFDKGAFTPGVGYTSYHAKERPCCGTRHLNGCPHVGCHIVCGDCRAVLGLVLGDERPPVPTACSECGSADVYFLADVLHDPRPCCDAMRVTPGRKEAWPLRQRCLSCGAWLRGERLRIARGEPVPARRRR